MSERSKSRSRFARPASAPAPPSSSIFLRHIMYAIGFMRVNSSSLMPVPTFVTCAGCVSFLQLHTVVLGIIPVTHVGPFVVLHAVLRSSVQVAVVGGASAQTSGTAAVGSVVVQVTGAG